MNLQELREMVGSIVDYDPDVQTYRDEVTRVVNELYLDFFTDKPWTFAIKSSEISVYKDVKVTNGAFAIGASTVTSTSNPFRDWMNGAIVEISGSTTPSEDGEYEIEKFGAVGTIYLKGFVATATTPANLTVTVKQRYVDMPKNCAEVIAVGLRNPTQTPTTAFDYLPRFRDEEYGLLLSAQGQPTDWLLHDDETVLSPVLAPTIQEDVAGPWIAGEYHVKYTLIYQNRESSPSPASPVTLGAGGKKIEVTGMQDTGLNSGYTKRFYVRTTETKAYYHVSEADVAETTTTVASLTVPTQYLISQDRLPENSGHYKRIRLYPRQDTDYLVSLRYIYQPPRLIEDSDTPEFPPSHHRYLVYRACQELFVKHDNLSHSEVYKRKADIELLRLENNYLSAGAGSWEMQSFAGSEYLTRANTTLTWLG